MAEGKTYEELLGRGLALKDLSLEDLLRIFLEECVDFGDPLNLKLKTDAVLSVGSIPDEVGVHGRDSEGTIRPVRVDSSGRVIPGQGTVEIQTEDGIGTSPRPVDITGALSAAIENTGGETLYYSVDGTNYARLLPSAEDSQGNPVSIDRVGPLPCAGKTQLSLKTISGTTNANVLIFKAV